MNLVAKTHSPPVERATTGDTVNSCRRQLLRRARGQRAKRWVASVRVAFTAARSFSLGLFPGPASHIFTAALLKSSSGLRSWAASSRGYSWGSQPHLRRLAACARCRAILMPGDSLRMRVPAHCCAVWRLRPCQRQAWVSLGGREVDGSRRGPPVAALLDGRCLSTLSRALAVCVG